MRPQRDSKIKILDNEYFRSQQSKQKELKNQQRAIQNYRFGRKALLTIVVIITLVSILKMVTNYRQTVVLKRQIAQQEKRLEKKKDRQKDLKEQVKQLNNLDYIEKVIRDKYSYSKKGEIIYNLPTDALKKDNQISTHTNN